MDERDYLLTSSVHCEFNDVIEDQPWNPANVISLAPTSFRGHEDNDDDSGIFCSPSSLRSDPTVSLSYWLGHLLNSKVLAGRDLLLKQLLSEAEFEESLPPEQAIVLPTSPLPPRIANRPVPPSFSPPLRSSTPKNDRVVTHRKRKLGVIETTTTSTLEVAESLLEVSRRLDSLLSRSREMSRDLKSVRKDLTGIEKNLIIAADDCKKARDDLQVINNAEKESRDLFKGDHKSVGDMQGSGRKSSLTQILVSGCRNLAAIDCPTFCLNRTADEDEDDIEPESDEESWGATRARSTPSRSKMSNFCRSNRSESNSSSTDKLLVTSSSDYHDDPVFIVSVQPDQPIFESKQSDALTQLSPDAIQVRSSLIELVNYFDLDNIDDLEFNFPISSCFSSDALKCVSSNPNLRQPWRRGRSDGKNYIV